MYIPLSSWKGDKNQEFENRVWDGLLKDLGAPALEEKLRRMPILPGDNINSYNAYNRKWPFDAKKKWIPLDKVEDFISSDSPSYEEQAILAEEQERFMNSLTDKQRFVVEKTGEGYKPREIASMQGDGESGKVRWHLFASRRKLREHNESEEE